MRALLLGLVIGLVGLASASSTAASSHHGSHHGKGGKKTAGKKGSKKTTGKKGGKKTTGKKGGKKGGKQTAGKNGKTSNKLPKKVQDQLKKTAANPNVTPAQSGALYAGMSGYSLSDGQRNALSELAADDSSGLTSEQREAISMLLEKDAENKDEQLAADDESSDNADGHLQLRRYLLLRNETGEPLTIQVQFRMFSGHGEWSWFPADPRRSDKALKYTLSPGKALYLTDGESRVATSKVRIWAEGLKTGTKWVDYKDQDLWLVPEVSKGSHHGYHDDKIQTVSMQLTRPADSPELLAALARR